MLAPGAAFGPGPGSVPRARITVMAIAPGRSARSSGALPRASAGLQGELGGLGVLAELPAAAYRSADNGQVALLSALLPQRPLTDLLDSCLSSSATCVRSLPCWI